MKAITKLLAGGVGIAALASAAPAAAQFFPGYGGYGYPGYGYGAGSVIGSIINSVAGGGYGYSPYGYGTGVNSQVAVNQCANAVQARLSGGYGGYGYNGYASPYGYAGARVLGISRVQPRAEGGLTVRGVATTGRYGAAQPDLTWRCKTDFRGFVVDTDVSLAQPAYGYGYTPEAYTPYNPYSQYGYVRY